MNDNESSDHSLQEIADMFGVSRQAVHSSISRIISRILKDMFWRKVLREYWEESVDFNGMPTGCRQTPNRIEYDKNDDSLNDDSSVSW